MLFEPLVPLKNTCSSVLIAEQPEKRKHKQKHVKKMQELQKAQITVIFS